MAIIKSATNNRNLSLNAAKTHSRQTLTMLAVAAYTAFSCHLILAAEEMSQRDVLRKAIEYRQAHFQKGRVVILEETSRPDERGSEFQYSATIRDGKIKVSRECRHAGASDWSGKDTFVVANGIYIENVESHPGIIVRTASCKAGSRDDDRRFAFDPRALGMVLGGTSAMGRHGIDAFATLFANEVAPASEVELAGRKVMKIERQLEDGRLIELTLDPSCEYSILSATLTQGKLAIKMETEYQMLAAGWFPATCSIVSMWDGKVTDTTKLTVKKVDFAASVSDNEFTIAGLQLAPGRVVVDDSGKAEVWNGSALVPYQTPARLPNGELDLD